MGDIYTDRLQSQVEKLKRENALLRDQASTESHSRLMAEEELGKTEDQLQMALDAAGLAMWQWDVLVGNLFTSARFSEILHDAKLPDDTGRHWTPQELASRIPAEDRARVRLAIVRVLKQLDPRLDIEFRIQPERTNPRTVLWLECTGEVTQRDMLGQAERLVGIVRDVTRRREIQQEIESAHAQAETARAQAELARAQAVSANAAKDDFLAHISHEIRTPLNGVIGMNNLLAQTSLSPEQRQYVELVGSSGRALLALVNDVLDYSRLEAHKLILEQVRFPLRRWLWEVVAPQRVSAQAKGLELMLQAGEKMPSEAVGDPGRLRQIVTNLVSNAIKFTDQGRIDVAMWADTLDSHRIELYLRVSDSGIGIAEDRQDSIFGAFVQADSSTSRVYGGTGLGLSICAKLVQLMGGHIDLDSAPGHGSRFTVSIPLGIADDDMPSTQFGDETLDDSQLPDTSSVQATTSQALALQFSGKRALVVDDHSVNQLLASKLLELRGFEVQVAHDGEQALQAIHAKAFDLVLMDIQMPRMNGWQATHHIRQWEKVEKKIRVPIIALSAHASAADREQALASGMDGYLSKPLTPEALHAALRATGLALLPGGPDSVIPDAESMPIADIAQPSKSKSKATAADPGKTNKPVATHDRDRLLGRLGGDELALKTMVQAFREDLRSSMALAFEAVKKHDFSALRQQAHALKGLLLSITADSAAQEAAVLERAAKAADAAQARAAFQRLSEAAKLVFNAVSRW